METKLIKIISRGEKDIRGKYHYTIDLNDRIIFLKFDTEKTDDELIEYANQLVDTIVTEETNTL